jgi:hypothetical protein
MNMAASAGAMSASAEVNFSRAVLPKFPLNSNGRIASY